MKKKTGGNRIKIRKKEREEEERKRGKEEQTENSVEIRPHEVVSIIRNLNYEWNNNRRGASFGRKDDIRASIGIITRSLLRGEKRVLQSIKRGVYA